MSILTTGKTFANGEQLSAEKLNQVISGATFNQSDAVDGSSITLIGGAIAVNDGGVTFAKLADVIDSDTMTGASATKLATSESIKAYVDDNSNPLKASTATGTIAGAISYTELDLSSVVGSNKAMVIMEVYNGNTGGAFHFRTKGSPVTFTQFSASSVSISSGNAGGTIVVTTDSAGKLEFLASPSITGVTYAVQGFQVMS